jgi:hypothetical protein
MRFGANIRLAWSIAFASIALWAATAPAGFGHLFQTGPSAGNPIDSQDQVEATSRHASVHTQQSTVTLWGSQDSPAQIPPCDPVEPTVEADEQANHAQATAPVPTPASNGGSGPEATFQLCGGSHAQTARAIEQLIGGRSFRARLNSRSDGCAELTIAVSAQPAGSVGGRQSTNLTVSSGSVNGAPGRTISVQIVTENGATSVNIGAGT